MILARSEIKKRVGSDGLISDYSDDCLESCGYDLRFKKAYKIESDSFMGVSERKTPEVAEILVDPIVIKPKEYILIETLEAVKMPDDLMARILPRSSIFRMGCILATAVVDPGFQGTLTMGLFNQSEYDFTLEKKSR
ncbi:MAG: hypothetical protein ABH851_06160, partial [Methanobacteriota archaeon]